MKIDQNKKYYTIYCHKNKINGKVYIGQTCQETNRRWRNGEGYSHCSYFYAAIQKYGFNNFQSIILKDNLTLEEANKEEENFIKMYDSINPDKGYNLEKGGLNKNHSEETKKKIQCMESMLPMQKKYYVLKQMKY